MKRIELIGLPVNRFPTGHPRCLYGGSTLWRATSRRFGVTAYGRTAQEAKQRLFITTVVEQSNRGAFYAGMIIGIARDWDKRLT